MIKVRVSKQSKNENTFRTPIEELDLIQQKPVKGLPFTIKSSTHDSGGIQTSIVTHVEEIEDKGFIIHTENSKYKIEYI